MSSTDLISSENVLKRTSQEIVDVIYDSLEIVDNVLRSAKINYTIICGTMLGSYRHGGLIPWDDDGDIAIKRQDEQKLLALTDTFAERGFILDIEPTFGGYRVWDPLRTIIRVSDKVYLPFIDVFLIDIEDNQYDVCDYSKDLFPGEVLPFGCFERLVDVPFGHLTLRGLNAADAQRHFDENFGTDWRLVAWRIFDHVTGDELPKVRIALDRPDLLRPALHLQHTAIKLSPFSSKSILNCSENDRIDPEKDIFLN